MALVYHLPDIIPSPAALFGGLKGAGTDMEEERIDYNKIKAIHVVGILSGRCFNNVSSC